MDQFPLQVKRLNHWFGTGDARKQALFDIDLSIPRGSFTALVGPSGSGKTTLLMMIAGFEVPHTHVHLIPMMSMADISFANAAATVDRDDLEAAAESIRGQLRAAGHSAAV